MNNNRFLVTIGSEQIRTSVHGCGSERMIEMEHRLDWEMLEQFRRMLVDEERSEATIKKYTHDVKEFYEYTGQEGQVDKERVISYKKELLEKYAVTSVNSMIAALNRFFKFMEWYDCMIKACRVQQEAFRQKDRDLTKEDYYRLLETARKKGKSRLYLIMKTICSTGIRVGELRFITVQAVADGQATVSLKGKTRKVLIPTELRRELRKYLKKKGIREGSIFVSRNGNPLDRSNILHEMKALCEDAHLDQSKVFPHNLRHLFACTFYRMSKDIARLADLLGHSNINTTRIYTRAGREEQRRQIDRMGLAI